MNLRNPFLAAAAMIAAMITAQADGRKKAPPTIAAPAVPLSFEANRGQAPSGVRFLSRSKQFSMTMSDDRVNFLSAKGAIEMRFAGANSRPGIEGLEAMSGRSHYYGGNIPRNWQANVTNYGRVRYRGLYPGVDAVFYGNDNQLEYDLIVAPRADTSTIRLKFDPGVKLSFDREGNLAMSSGGLTLVQHKPIVYQEKHGARVPVGAAFHLVDSSTVGFTLAGYDRDSTLIIDPIINYATYIGGLANDRLRKMALDAAGNIYIVGQTDSVNFPTRPQGNTFGKLDAVVMKLDPTGRQLLYSAILGGSQNDSGFSIAVDAAGNAYVTGYTESPEFPVLSAVQPVYRGKRDAFVAKLGPNGDLRYSTFLGGGQSQPCGCDAFENGYGIAVNALGQAGVVGYTYSADFPVTVQPTSTPDHGEAFVTLLSASGSELVYSMYIGRPDGDDALYTAVFNGAGDLFVGGSTTSATFPTTEGAFRRTFAGGTFYGDAWIARITRQPDGRPLIMASTLFGGASDDTINGIALDTSDNVYVTGGTESYNLPTVSGVMQGGYAGGDIWGDAFIAKLNPTLTTRIYATYYGSSGDEWGVGIRVDAAGAAYVTGFTESAFLPMTTDAYQKTFGGRSDIFVLKLAPNGSKAEYATFIGKTDWDEGYDLEVKANGQVWIVGDTRGAGFPGVNDSSYQSNWGGSYDSFLVRMDFTPSPTTPTTPTTPTSSVRVASVVNAATFTAGRIAPGQIVVVFGSGMGPQQLAQAAPNANGMFPKILADVQIFFDGIAAPLIYVSANQSAAIVPYSVDGKTAVQVVVRYQSVSSEALSMQVGPAAPGLFSADQSGKGRGAILNQDGSLNSPDRPAAPGAVIVVYGTGEGQTTPNGVDGKLAPGVFEQLPRPTQFPRATIGGLPATVLYAGAVPFVVAGEFQMNLSVPNLPPGDHEVLAWFGDQRSQTGITVRVQ